MSEAAGNIQAKKKPAKKQAEVVQQNNESIVEIPLSELYPLPGHPFSVNDDDLMTQTTNSIKSYGVLVPGIVRPREGGGYEIVAGHRRKRGCELAERTTMPCVVRNLDYDSAVIIMVDSNIQRENTPISERAKAYKMKLEAIKRQAGRPSKENAPKISANFRSDDEIGATMGLSGDILLESDNGDTVLSSGWVIDGHNYLPEHTDGIMKKSNVFSTVMPDSSEFGERCSLYIGTHPSYTFKAPTGVMVEYIYIWSPNGAVLPDNAESSSDPMDVDTFDGIVDYNEDGGLPLIVIGGIAVGGLAAVAAIIAAIAKAAAAKAAAAAQAAVVPETVSYQPEVYDWRGNRIDENARVRQTEQEYVQANRETQAQLDAERERIRLAEEAARQKAIDDHNAYVERLSKKYFGTISSSERAKAEMAKRILENRGREETIQKYIGRYQRYSHGLETLTGLVESGSDIFIDVGGDMGGPVGKGIRAGYKVIKPAIKNFCERGSTMRSVLSAAIKGAGDAASDFLPADGKGKELAKQMAKKAGVQFTGELTGELIDEGGSVTRAVYNTAVKTVINTAKDEIGSSNFIKGSTSKWSEGGKRYLMSTSGTLAENSLSMKGAK